MGAGGGAERSELETKSERGGEAAVRPRRRSSRAPGWPGVGTERSELETKASAEAKRPLDRAGAADERSELETKPQFEVGRLSRLSASVAEGWVGLRLSAIS